MNENEIAIVCSLTDSEFRERERTMMQQIKTSVKETNETEGGYIFRFPPDEDSFAMLSEFIVLERRCCPFLDFKMTVPRGQGDILLELSGPEGAKEFIAANFKA